METEQSRQERRAHLNVEKVMLMEPISCYREWNSSTEVTDKATDAFTCTRTEYMHRVHAPSTEFQKRNKALDFYTTYSCVWDTRNSNCLEDGGRKFSRSGGKILQGHMTSRYRRLIPGSRVFLEKLIVAQLRTFIRPEGSSPCSQKPAHFPPSSVR
jgi:hypothetical protein